MPVGTGDISLAEVCIEIYGAAIAGYSLVGCFADAKADGFKDIYEGNKDRLSNFRGYNHNPVQLDVLPLSTTGANGSLDGCLQGGSINRYTDSTAPFPGIGDTIYIDIGGTAFFNGENKYWKDVGNELSLRIDGYGVITATTFC